MAIVKKQIFEWEKDLLETDCPGDDDNVIQLKFRTLGGTALVLSGLERTTTMSEVRLRAAELVGAPAFTVKLLWNDAELCGDGETIASAGLTGADVCITLIRCPASRAEWVKLFGQLVCAINGRQPKEARTLIDQGAGLDGDGNILRAGHRMRFPGDRTAEESEPGNTMLHLAIRQGLPDLALYLVSREVDVNNCSDTGRSPLMMAILKKQTEVVQVLLAAQADVSFQDYLGNSALAYALKNGDDGLCAQLVALGRGTEAVGTFAGLLPVLHRDSTVRVQAVLHRDSTGVAQPVQTIDSTVLSGSFPVLTCCACGFPRTAVALLQSGAEHEGFDARGRTALHYAHALDEHHYGIDRMTLLDALIEKGADVGAVDKLGNLPEAGVEEHPAVETKPPRCSIGLRSVWAWKWLL